MKNKAYKGGYACHHKGRSGQAAMIVGNTGETFRLKDLGHNGIADSHQHGGQKHKRHIIGGDQGSA